MMAPIGIDWGWHSIHQFRFNAHAQQADMAYDVLRLPERTMRDIFRLCIFAEVETPRCRS